jgi:DNA-directed RNA polymerase specialized sigma24 family protein
VSVTLPQLSADDKQGQPSEISALLAQLGTVYAFALTLTGDQGLASAVTERVFTAARDDVWSTLGGHSLRHRLLALCVSAFAETVAAQAPEAPTAQPGTAQRPSTRLAAVLRELPWKERAAIAFVDQLDLSYMDAAVVLGVDIAQFRALLHGGRSALFAAYRTGARENLARTVHLRTASKVTVVSYHRSATRRTVS